MFKRALQHKGSSASLNKKHNRITSSTSFPAPGRTLIMSAGPSTNNSSCSSLVSEAPPHRRAPSYSLGLSLAPTMEEPLTFSSEPLFNDSFLSSEPSDDYYESSAKSQYQRLPPISIHSYTQKFPHIEEVEVDNDSILSVEDSRVTSIYDGNDVATAVYIARPVTKPRMVDISPPSGSHRNSLSPSEASVQSSSYFGRKSYSRTSSFSTSSDLDSEPTQATATPITPPSMHGDSEVKDNKDVDVATAVSVARISHVRNLSGSAPKHLRERVAARRSADLAVPCQVRVVQTQHLRAASLDTKRPPMPPLRRSSVAFSAPVSPRS